MEAAPLKVEISHTLDKEQLDAIYNQVYDVTLDAIKQARRDSEIDNDLIFSKVDLRHFLGGVSPDYLETLLARGMPQGRTLSERKICFSKRAIKKWLLENK